MSWEYWIGRAARHRESAIGRAIIVTPNGAATCIAPVMPARRREHIRSARAILVNVGTWRRLGCPGFGPLPLP